MLRNWTIKDVAQWKANTHAYLSFVSSSFLFGFIQLCCCCCCFLSAATLCQCWELENNRTVVLWTTLWVAAEEIDSLINSFAWQSKRRWYMVKFWCLAYLLTLPQIWHFGVFFHTSLTLFCLRAAAVSISYPSPANHLPITCQSVHCRFEQHSTNKWHLCVRVCVQQSQKNCSYCGILWSCMVLGVAPPPIFQVEACCDKVLVPFWTRVGTLLNSFYRPD